MPVINEKATGDKITQLQEAAGMTVKDLQQIFGFATPQAIYKWRKGTSIPAIDNLIVLAAVFGCKIDDLIVIDTIKYTLGPVV